MITKSYAAGGTDGSLDIIDTDASLAQAVAQSNRRLRAWINDDEVYLSELQRKEPAQLETTRIDSAFATGAALFVGDWSDVDNEAAFRYRDSDIRWAVLGEPVSLYYDGSPATLH